MSTHVHTWLKLKKEKHTLNSLYASSVSAPCLRAQQGALSAAQPPRPGPVALQPEGTRAHTDEGRGRGTGRPPFCGRRVHFQSPISSKQMRATPQNSMYMWFYCPLEHENRHLDFILGQLGQRPEMHTRPPPSGFAAYGRADPGHPCRPLSHPPSAAAGPTYSRTACVAACGW